MNHEIKLYGPIGGYWNSAEEILGSIPGNATQITLRIHSPGGSVGEGLAIYHGLRDHAARVKTIVDGYAASSASFVMLAGDEREVHRNSIVFVHNPWSYAEGNADELRKTADGLDVHAAAIADIYKQRTGLGEDEIRDMMDETEFFRGVDAKEKGFATAVIDDAEAEAQIAAMLTFEGLAAQMKESTGMKTRKEIEAAAAEAMAQVTTLTNSNAELTTKAAELQAQIDAAEAAKVATAKAHEEALAALTTERDEAQAQIAERDQQIQDITTQRDEAQATVKSQAEQLKNPAFQDAIAKEAEAKAKAAADAEAEEAEKKAAEAKAKAEAAEKPSYDKWQGIEDPGEKRAYYEEHRDAIIATMDAEPEDDNAE